MILYCNQLIVVSPKQFLKTTQKTLDNISHSSVHHFLRADGSNLLNVKYIHIFIYLIVLILFVPLKSIRKSLYGTLLIKLHKGISLAIIKTFH